MHVVELVSGLWSRVLQLLVCGGNTAHSMTRTNSRDMFGPDRTLVRADKMLSRLFIDVFPRRRSGRTLTAPLFLLTRLIISASRFTFCFFCFLVVFLFPGQHLDCVSIRPIVDPICCFIAALTGTCDTPWCCPHCHDDGRRCRALLAPMRQ